MEPVRLPDVGDRFLDEWTIEAQVGKGGFSIVYRALHDDGRVAAIKILMPESNTKVTSKSYDSEIAERFLREARLLDQLDSAYTIRLWDYGESPDPLLYMVFEFIDGQMLFDEIKKNGAMPFERVVHVLRQTLIALESAHALGILHRDIKPNNIMLYERDGDAYRVKLVDFGIAKMFDEDKAIEGNDLTAAGLLVGTPRYMSPEQLKGQDLTPAADLYSLGLCAIEMLSGRKCIPGKDRVKIVERQLGPEQVCIPDDIDADPELAKIVHHLTQKKVRDRYTSATEVLRDLEALAGDPGATGDTVFQTIPKDLDAFLNAPSGENDDTVFETVNTAEIAALIEQQRKSAVQPASPAEEDSEGSIDPFGLTMAGQAVTPDMQAQIDLLRATDATVQGGPEDDAPSFGDLASPYPPVGGGPSGFQASFDQLYGNEPVAKPPPPASQSHGSGQFQQPPAAQSYGSGQFQQPPAAQSYGSGQFQQPPAAQSYGSGQFQQPPAAQSYGSGQFQQPPAAQSYGSGQFQQPPGAGQPYGSGQFQQPPGPYGSGQYPQPPGPYGSGQYPAPMQSNYQGQPPYNGPPGFGPPGHHPPGPPQQFRPPLTGDDKLALGAAFIVPGVGQIIAGQVVKGGIIMVALLLLFVFLSGFVWVAFAPLAVADTYLLVRAQKRRPVGAFEFFADFRDLL